MVSRPGRAKTADVPDDDFLEAIDTYSRGGLWVDAAFPHTHPKILIAKLRKLQKRGLVTNEGGRYSLTPAGREALVA